MTYFTMQALSYDELSGMGLSRLMKVANDPDIKKNTRLDAAGLFNERVKERYGITGQGDRFDVLQKDKKKSLIKLWVLYKNKVKPNGWPATYFSYDLAMERQLFEDEEMVRSRFENEGIYCLKNFYGINRPLTGYEKLYNFSLKLYNDRRLLQLRFYLNTYYTEQENGGFMPTEIQSWAINNGTERSDNVVQM